MDSQASELLTTVCPKRGRRSFKLFFGTLLGFAIMLYCVPDDPKQIQTERTPKRQVKRLSIPLWTWKTLLNGRMDGELSPLMANTAFRGEESMDAATPMKGEAPKSGSALATTRTGSKDAKEALSRIAKSESDRLARDAFAKTKDRSPASLQAARVPGAVAVMGASLATGRVMKVRIGDSTALKAQVQKNQGSDRDYRIQVEREIPGSGTSFASAMGSSSGLNQFSVRQRIGDGWNVGVDRTRSEVKTSDRTEHAVTLGFSSNF